MQNKKNIEDRWSVTERENSFETKLRQKYRSGFLKGMLLAVIICAAAVLIFNWIKDNQKITVGVYGSQKGGKHQVQSYDALLDQAAIDKINYLAAFIQANYYEEVDIDQLLNGLYKGMYESLDQYSDYYTEEEYQEILSTEVQGNYSGIGAVLQQNSKTKQVKVVRIQDGSPAEKAGLKVGDTIVKADQYQADQMSLSEFVGHLKGEEGTTVHLTVQREGTEGSLEMDVTRKQMESISVYYEMFEDQIGYIQITEFTDTTPKQFEQALEALQKQELKGLIVDLRNNLGGMVNAVTQILDDILPEGLIVYTEDKAGNREEFKSTDEKYLSVPLTVLVNGSSASASEIFAGAIKDRDYGTLIGTKTFGKGIVQGIQSFKDQTAVKLTISRYYTPNGTCIQGKGIEPDIVLEYKFQGKDGDDYSYSLDNQIQKAIEILKEEINK